MAIQVKCPQCEKMTEYSDKNPWRPFCCERCKIIDLGAWANEDYVIHGRPIEGDDDLDISKDSLAKGKIHTKKSIEH